MLHPAFIDELTKIAFEAQVKYQRRKGVQVQVGIPIIRKLPKDKDALQEKLRELATRKTKNRPLGYSNVAIPSGLMPHPESLGFKRTRIAAPIPGERPFTSSWRKGCLHVHKQGPVYLLHSDKIPPMGRLGYVSPKAVAHGLKEGLPAVLKRTRRGGRKPLAKEAE